MTKDISIYYWRVLIYYIIHEKLDSYYHIAYYFKKGYSILYSKAKDELMKTIFNKNLKLIEKYEFLESDIARTIIKKYEKEILEEFDKESLIVKDYEFIPDELINKIFIYLLNPVDELGLLKQFFKEKRNKDLFIRTIRNNPLLIKELKRQGYPLDRIINNIQKLNF